MRALLALDGSPSSRASELAASLAWPSGSNRRRRRGRHLDRGRPHAAAAGGDARRRRRRADGGVPRRPPHDPGGPRGQRPVELAADLRAELVDRRQPRAGAVAFDAAGVRARPRSSTTPRAPCSSWPGRGGSLLVAVDGSPSADGAVSYLIANKILAGRPIEVLSVAPGPDLPIMLPLPEGADRPLEPAEGRLVEDRWRAEATAAEVARRLDECGYSVRWSIGTGDAAHEIITAAQNFDTGLIVMGSRGHTGLTRLLLGSVARNVLLHTAASVLVVREPLRVAVPEEAKVAGPRGAAGGRLRLRASGADPAPRGSAPAGVGQACRPPATASGSPVRASVAAGSTGRPPWAATRGGWTTSTEQGACVTMLRATLPSTSRVRPVLPRVPTTMQVAAGRLDRLDELVGGIAVADAAGGLVAGADEPLDDRL